MGLLKFFRQIFGSDPASTTSSLAIKKYEEESSYPHITPHINCSQNIHQIDAPRRPVLSQPPTTNNYSGIINGIYASAGGTKERDHSNNIVPPKNYKNPASSSDSASTTSSLAIKKYEEESSYPHITPHINRSQNIHQIDAPRRPVLSQPPTTNNYSGIINGIYASAGAPREPVSQPPALNNRPDVNNFTKNDTPRMPVFSRPLEANCRNSIPKYDAPRKPLIGERSNITGISEITIKTNVTKPFTQTPAKVIVLPPFSETMAKKETKAIVIQPLKIQPPAKKEANEIQPLKTQPPANAIQPLKTRPPAKKGANVAAKPQHKSQGKGSDKNNSGNQQQYTFQKKPFLLEKLCKLSPEKLLIELSCDINSLETFLGKTIKPINIFLFVRCLGKLTTVQFDMAKIKLFKIVCESNFVKILEDHCMKLPQNHDSDNATELLQNVLIFCEAVVDFSPILAMSQLKPLLEVVKSKVHRREIFTSELHKAFTKTNGKFTTCVEEDDKKKLPALKFSQKAGRKVPPNNIRDVAIVPSKEELLGDPGFVRPNIVEGAYDSVEHYLDVQFRLMREDFVTPLREAIKEYLSCPNKKEYGGARFYKNARLQKYKMQRGVLVLELFIPAIRQKHPDDEINDKLFMYGSLLCLTCDHFDTVLICMVHDAYSMKYGKISVIEAWGKPVTGDMFAKNFLVVESSCYFAPYFNILRVLQSPNTAQNFPFERYLVQSQADELPPNYLKDFQEYELFNGSTVKLLNNRVAKPWSEDIGLDATQYEAYTKALCRQFVTIQGPPGTGKTYIAKKIASTILQNCYLNGRKNLSPILVVCCTNHALDQFLEGLLGVTNKLVRVGGQSKNESLEKYNLRNLRKRNHGIPELESDLFDNARHLETFLAILESIQSKDVIFDLTKNQRMFYFHQEDIEQRFDLPFDLEMFLDNFDGENRPALVNWLLLSDYDDDSKRNFINSTLSSRPRGKSSPLSESANNYNDPKVKVRYTSDYFEFSLDELCEELDNLESSKGSGNKHVKLRKIADCQLELNYLEMRLARGNIGYMKVRFSEEMDPFSFSPEQRWSLYWEWLNLAKADILDQFSEALKINQAEKMYVEEMKQLLDLHILKQNYVVGMTTSGAARNHSLLRSLGAPIVIVEEAAEVMESHVVVSLTKDCQHLIMIGDHQQLRPITATHKMGTQYNLDVSLFERMVNNGSHCYQLGVQHRMRPEIARLITPAIYKNLKNNSNVEEYPNIKGVTKSLFFIDHTVPEDKRRQSTSRRNDHEARFLLELANYFIQQGYDPEEITILSTYAEQTLHMCSMRANLPELEGVEICNLDGFQGEENKIILLSLVRSNPEGNIGFLKTNNRVCVALSRAREGFYMIGNMNILKKQSPLWKAVNNTLTGLNSIGANLILRCEFHPSMNTAVKTASDFSKVPNGGCKLPCATPLSCGHTCELACHPTNRLHEGIKCTQRCLEIICAELHHCPLECYEECPSICHQSIWRSLPCSHRVLLKCHQNYRNYRCTFNVTEILACRHQRDTMCHETRLNRPCVQRLLCGHACNACWCTDTDSDF